VIQVEELTKRYGQFKALDGATFTAKKRQIVGFLGPNGAGKTTTMRILTGYMPPTSGKATVAGFDVTTESLDVRMNIGYLPETVPLYPDMTVKGYVEFMAELRGIRGKRKRVAAQDALERVDLQDRAYSLVRNISKGMRQRLGLAQAIVHDPLVLILDEPTIGLDPQQVRDVRSLVQTLSDERTVLFSTHILSEAEQVCDEVVIINNGQIVAQGAPTALRDRLQISGRVYVRGRGNLQKMKDTLKKVPNVQSVDPFQDGFAVRIAANKEIRPQIATMLHDANIELLELRPLATTLEDIFIELTEATRRA